jgi:hypothetical protein
MSPTLRARHPHPITSPKPRKSRGKGKTSLIAVPPPKKPLRARNRKRKSVCSEPTTGNSPSNPVSHPRNPQATFLGLPAELRLAIYSYVFDSTLIHVHHHLAGEKDYSGPEFTWTSCRAVNPQCPLLCLNPKWSGMCEEADRCTYRPLLPTIPTGFAALSWACRLIRNETQEFFLKNTTVSMHERTFRPWLGFMKAKAPQQLALVNRITLEGPDHWTNLFEAAFNDLRTSMPNIQGVAFQGQVPGYVVAQLNSDHQLRNSLNRRFSNWGVLRALRRFGPHVAIAIEGIALRKPRRFWPSGPVVEQQSLVRIIRDGKDGDGWVQQPGSNIGWALDAVHFEHLNPNLVAYKRTAKWRQWWRSKVAKQIVN